MALTSAQIKGRIKNIAKTNTADARILMRIYMMERFLERVSNSRYAENFVIKGGILVTSLVGVSLRSTMDIDTSIHDLNLSKNDIVPVINEICDLDMQDGVKFIIQDVTSIMDEMEYPGIRFLIDVYLDKMITPIKIDVSTGDVITPGAIKYDYKLLLEDRFIKLCSYNIETIIAEKLQTILARGVLNTRMRDYYDIYTLLLCYGNGIDKAVLKRAFEATCDNRNTNGLIDSGARILNSIMSDDRQNSLWASYQQKYTYAKDIPFESAIKNVVRAYEMVR